MTKQTIAKFDRNSYGEIINHKNNFGKTYTPYLADLLEEASCMIASAAKTKKIPRSYDTLEWDRKKRASGSALHHEIYDVSGDGRHALICLRETQGNGKYGVSTTSKTYVIISAHGKGVRVEETSKAKAAKAAKQAVNPGDAIQVCLGKKKLVVNSPVTSIQSGYKIVGMDDEKFWSVYDTDLEWAVGKTRIEKSSMNHESGYYVFPTMESALAAWKQRLVFADEWMRAEKYAILKCECGGRAYRHNNNKICISRVTPVEQVATLIA